jgi:hypothetical protein
LLRRKLELSLLISEISCRNCRTRSVTDNVIATE